MSGAEKAELVAVGRAYFEATNKALATGDELPLRPLSTPECPCNKALESIKSATDAGQRFRVVYEITDARALTLADGSKVVQLKYDIDSNTVVDSAGKVIETNPPVKDGIKELVLVSVKDKWLVSKITTYK